MAVITTDILLSGIRREEAFTWMSEFSHHRSFLSGAFQVAETNRPKVLELTFKGTFKTRSFEYELHQIDNAHGGRRIKIKTRGKRTSGLLSYSLRTMKPSSNTLLTIHFDYQPGSLLGQILDQISLNEALERCWSQVAQQIAAEINNGK